MSGCTGPGGEDGGPDATFAVFAEAPRASGVAEGAFDGDEPGGSAPLAALADPGWLDRTAEATGIPRRALQGYAGAALVLAEQQPDCRVGWNTLAGIGWVESHHGTIFGGSIQPDGRTSDLIIGVALDGQGFQEIADTDGGAVDGDTEWDRAVGPMQFVPATWAAWATEGNGDGVPDIHNIDDASLSAAEYLCYSGRDDGGLGTEAGWRAAIAAYNESPAYLDEVLEYANRYAEESAAASADPTPAAG
ncbi:lytic transglycosylase domain-containing protein [Herbiconiux moechotypicola]|nr:lytic transglycosylase domain-containing protein [Herbiconiux moechotypicola]